MKRFILICCVFCMLFCGPVYAGGAALDINAKSAILLEQSTGEVLFEENADERLPIASVTKIMTMLLIMEDMDKGVFTMEDMVPVSERAMAMGGSTMFLEAGEELSVYEILKGIAVASANDGTVAMAEYISGSVEGFVERMNERAKELGMENTHFLNPHGLDEDGHFSCARDVALMSRELLKHDKIYDFTTIWTDKMHNGKYDLSNTNKLIRFYPGATGLKTGSTSKALCCLSASAVRDDMGLIAVVLAAPTSKDRFNGARALLDYGFANYAVCHIVSSGDITGEVQVVKGKDETVTAEAAEDFSLLLPKGEKETAEKETVLPEKIKAPVYKGSMIGKIMITKDGETVANIPLIASRTVEKKGFFEYLGDVFSGLLR